MDIDNIDMDMEISSPLASPREYNHDHDRRHASKNGHVRRDTNQDGSSTSGTSREKSTTATTAVELAARPRKYSFGSSSNSEEEQEDIYEEIHTFDNNHHQNHNVDDSIESAHSAREDDSIHSIDSDVVRESSSRRRRDRDTSKSAKNDIRNNHRNKNDSIDDDDDEVQVCGGRSRSRRRDVDISIRNDSRLYKDPLKVYRPPKWAQRYVDRRREHDAQRTSKNKSKKDKGLRGQINMDDSYSYQKYQPEPLPTLTLLQDPFQGFGSRDSERLEVVANWWNGRDGTDTNVDDKSDTDNTNINANNDEDDESTLGKSVILSLSIRHVISLSIQLMFGNDVHATPRQSRHLDTRTSTKESRRNASLSSSSTEENGGTLIVARSKDDLAAWECALRETTSFAVLNHALISSADRRRVTISSRVVGFDIVLTTYDVIKAKEMNTAVDEKGRARIKNEIQGGWLSSSSSSGTSASSRQSQQEGNAASSSTGGTANVNTVQALSRLHGIKWYRLIFIDELGRQSYMTKPGTARAQAAATLKGERR